jgi:deazaflavin-dependent oxidoreductase (nitroreductase family)
MQESRANPCQPRKRTPFERVAEPIVASRPGAWFFVNVAPSIDRRLISWSRGRLTLAGSRRVGLLRVRGARSGAMRETPLVYTRDGDRVILVASRGGDVRHPAWYRNLVANPEVELWTRGGGGRYRAREATGKQRARLWQVATTFYPGFDSYQRRAGDRRIPVIVCSPEGE